MDDEKDTLLSVSRKDKNLLLVKGLLQESKQENKENLQPNLLFPRERKINYQLIMKSEK
jgi:hypothetical protein